MRALSIRQPWAWLIVNGHKPIENREWSTQYRGPLLIHAGKTMPRSYHEELAEYIEDDFGIQLPAYEALERGGIVGRATVVDCVSHSDSPWFQGPFGFVLAQAEPLPFFACNGKLSFFDVRLP